MNDKITNITKKLYALANNNDNSFESKAAKAKLDQLLERHNLSIDKILIPDRSDREIRWHTKADQKLISQILYMIYGDTDTRPMEMHYSHPSKKNLKITVIELSDMEYLNFIELYDYHRYRLWRELQKHQEHVMTAYMNANTIFPDKDLVDQNKEKVDTETDLDELLLLGSLVSTMKRGTPTRKLNAHE